MTNIETALARFEKLGFHKTEYTPNKEPINDSKRIQEITDEIEKSSLERGLLDRALLVEELKEQTVKTYESLECLQGFLSFRGLRWISNNKPHIVGKYTPAENTYLLTFFARAPEQIDNDIDVRIFFGLPMIIGYDKDTDEELKRLHSRALEIGRNRRKISDLVEISCNMFTLLQPPFQLKTKSENLEEAYTLLIETMSKVGYREGVVFKK